MRTDEELMAQAEKIFAADLEKEAEEWLDANVKAYENEPESKNP